jgi:hypothetical protein
MKGDAHKFIWCTMMTADAIYKLLYWHSYAMVIVEGDVTL